MGGNGFAPIQGLTSQQCNDLWAFEASERERRERYSIFDAAKQQLCPLAETSDS